MKYLRDFFKWLKRQETLGGTVKQEAVYRLRGVYSQRAPINEKGILRRLENGVALATKRIEKTVPAFKPYQITETAKKFLTAYSTQSINLIKINRATRTAAMLKRFEKWIGAANTADLEAIEGIEKQTKQHFASSDFIERRMLIDQEHKLQGNLELAIGVANGALGAVWYSNFKATNYNYREDHKARHGKFYALKGANIAAYFKPGKLEFLDSITKPGEEINCQCSCEYIYSLSDIPNGYLNNEGIRKSREFN